MKANALLIDMDEETMNKIWNKKQSELFDHDNLINSLEGSGSVCTRVRYSTAGDLINESIMERIR